MRVLSLVVFMFLGVTVFMRIGVEFINTILRAEIDLLASVDGAGVISRVIELASTDVLYSGH